MKTCRSVARLLVFGLTLAACSMPVHAQDEKTKKEQKEHKSGNQRSAQPAEQHGAPPAQQSAPVQHSAPQVQQHSAPPVPQNAPQVQQHSAPPQHQDNPSGMRPQRTDSAPQQQQPQQQQSPQIYQPRNPPNNPQNNQQGGRTFGNPPNRTPDAGSQPGRTFGGQPGGNRPVEAYRAPGNNNRPMPNAAPRTFTTRTGDTIHRDAGGHVTQVRMSNGAVVYHPANAPRRVEMTRPDGRVVVAGAAGHGYVQRQVVIQNTTIIKRTYIYNGVPQARIYRPRMYNGITLVVYTPVRYYRPAFYVYAYNPWARPVVYSWGWAGRPWYGYYGGYFTPYPVYASPTLWLTDYLIAATLESAYEERMAARAAAANAYADGQQVPMSPQVKQAIADEVRRQIELEKAEGQMGNNVGAVQDPFGGGTHVFVVHNALSVNSNYGGCSLGEGDVLQMNGPPPPNSPVADLIVLSSRGPDCRTSSTVTVQLQDLQEMQNQMRATIDRGMGDLQARQGQGGLPPLPQGAAGTTDSPLAQGAQPDNDSAREIASVSQEADRADQIVAQNPDTAPPTLSLGMGIDEVKSVQGEPEKIVDLGSKKIYVYKDLKITFTDGRVSDIQ